MRKENIFLIVVFIIYFFPSFAFSEIKEFCADKWPNDYRMREYCQNQQIEGQNELFSIAEKKGLVKNGSLSASSTGGDHEKIISCCMSKWGKSSFDTYDYKMVVYCIKQQFDSYDNIGASKSSKTGIEGFCADKWPDDFKMRKYCQNQQIEGNQELFSIAKVAGLVKNGSLSTSPQGGRTEKIINYCMSKWEKIRFKTYDYKMVVYCVKQQQR